MEHFVCVIGGRLVEVTRNKAAIFRPVGIDGCASFSVIIEGGGGSCRGGEGVDCCYSFESKTVFVVQGVTEVGSFQSGFVS